jgi:hypothetical protein
LPTKFQNRGASWEVGVAHPLPGAGRQTSQGKTRDLRAIHPAHLRPHPPGDIGLRVFWPPRPDADASCASCTSGRHFAYSFLQTPPRDKALAVRLTVPITRVRRGLSPPSHRSDTTPTKSRTKRPSQGPSPLTGFFDFGGAVAALKGPNETIQLVPLRVAITQSRRPRSRGAGGIGGQRGSQFVPAGSQQTGRRTNLRCDGARRFDPYQRAEPWHYQLGDLPMAFPTLAEATGAGGRDATIRHRTGNFHL